MATETRFETTIRKEQARDQAEQAFWAVIAAAFPEIRTGDMAPDQVFNFNQACRIAVDQWVENNRRG
jgi:hypothetical protein